MANQNVDLTLDDAVAEVLGMLTGLDLTYLPEEDRYRAITRQINRSLRANALEHEWSYYHSFEDVGVAHAGDRQFNLRASVRPRILGDDAVRLVDDDGNTRAFAYFLQRDALHKYNARGGLWVSVTRSMLEFNRAIRDYEDGLTIQVPVMREPKMFVLPDEGTTVPDAIRQQTVDFDYPDIVILRAAYYYAQTDPVMQPRVQTLEAQYKDLGYSLVSRDDANTDAPFLNEFFVPISGSIDGYTNPAAHWHPHSDERAW